MHPHITAGILERALHTTISAEACLAARGSVPLQSALTGQARQALTGHGADPHRPTGRHLLTCAAALRGSSPAPAADPHAVAAVLARAADRITAHGYGPAHGQLTGDIIDAVERCAPDLRLRFDVLTAIAQHLPVHHLTITAWEWTANPTGGPGAVALLRSLAARHAVPSFVPLPTEPVPDHYRIDLRDLEALARQTHAAQTGQPAPETEGTERRELTRAWQEAAAHAGSARGTGLADRCQDRADTLRDPRRSQAS